MPKRKNNKATNITVNQYFLDDRTRVSTKRGFKKQKWIQFCEVMLGKGFQVTLYEARHTVSKYVTVMCIDTGAIYKVRFSNHRPNRERERNQDCDFFVGRSNFQTTTTKQAIAATLAHFSGARHTDE